jgi:uncharacterized RDD family membrane protein YckC
MPGSASATDALVVETPERVALSLEVAGLGHRSLAFLIDWFILFFFWAAAVNGLSLVRPYLYEDLLGLSSILRALVIVVGFATNWAYDIGFETLRGGQTPGKRLMRIRVVRDDGSPVGFFESAARNLSRIVDSFPLLYGVGVISMIASPRAKRLGDYLAGTVVVRERRVDLAKYETESSPRGSVSLTAPEFELVSSYLARAAALDADSRSRVVRKLTEPIAARLPEAERSQVLASPEACEAFLRKVAGKGTA